MLNRRRGAWAPEPVGQSPHSRPTTTPIPLKLRGSQPGIQVAVTPERKICSPNNRSRKKTHPGESGADRCIQDCCCRPLSRFYFPLPGSNLPSPSEGARVTRAVALTARPAPPTPIAPRVSAPTASPRQASTAPSPATRTATAPAPTSVKAPARDRSAARTTAPPPPRTAAPHPLTPALRPRSPLQTPAAARRAATRRPPPLPSPHPATTAAWPPPSRSRPRSPTTWA